MTSRELTRAAISATLHCLTGCALGEILGMVLTTALGWGNAANIVVSIALAFVFGYTLAMRPVLGAGVPFRRALGIALASDTVSITSMELMDNLGLVTIPGAMDAGLGDWLFWASLVGTLAIAFVITVPVNRWLIARGKGHALVHQYHHAHSAN
ncbi:DUF4396 domain-containing protein [Actinoplanes sp. NPDC051411]|uniref:DUF4396 domain-containing protein n=1 Tax=Actinoplanes sp. NPDC051411 TaxID=3155522 RepID=UPI00343418C2